jgi:hypothetical protein
MFAVFCVLMLWPICIHFYDVSLTDFTKTCFCAALTKLPKLERLSAQGAHLSAARVEFLSLLSRYVLRRLRRAFVPLMPWHTQACVEQCVTIALHYRLNL